MQDPIERLDELQKKLEVHTETNARIFKELLDLCYQLQRNNEMILEMLSEKSNV